MGLESIGCYEFSWLSSLIWYLRIRKATANIQLSDVGSGQGNTDEESRG